MLLQGGAREQALRFGTDAADLYALSDMGTVAEVIDSRAFSEFCGVDSSNQVPDGDTLGRFRHIPEENGIQQNLFAEVVQNRGC